MKFGRNLPRNQVPEWDTSYIKYKALKKVVKSAAKDAHNGEAPDTAGIACAGRAFPTVLANACRILLLAGSQLGGCQPFLQPQVCGRIEKT